MTVESRDEAFLRNASWRSRGHSPSTMRTSAAIVAYKISRMFFGHGYICQKSVATNHVQCHIGSVQPDHARVVIGWCVRSGDNKLPGWRRHAIQLMRPEKSIHWGKQGGVLCT